MKIRSAEFVTSAPSLEAAPKLGGIPEFPLVGRSNVGKSSLINCLLQRKIAKTSNTPGKTRLMNYFRVNDNFALVDLPGYGWAKVSQTEREAWDRRLMQYLLEREEVRLVTQLIDSRHPPQANDRAMLDWLVQQDLPVLIVLTKVDKMTRTAAERQRDAAASLLGLDKERILTCSADTGAGRDEVLRALAAYM